MAYIITHNLIDCKPPKEITDEIVKKFPVKFRLFDDDGELYFEGRMSGNEGQDEFEPEDEIGVGYGCTETKLFNEDTKQWEVL